jgi:hypothetical protein
MASYTLTPPRLRHVTIIGTTVQDAYNRLYKYTHSPLKNVRISGGCIQGSIHLTDEDLADYWATSHIRDDGTRHAGDLTWYWMDGPDNFTTVLGTVVGT